MDEIINKIKDHYLDYLTSDQQLMLINNPTEKNLRYLVNTIWKQYLTDPFEFKEGEAFKFLVVKNVMDSPEYTEFMKLPIFIDTFHLVELMTNSDLKKDQINRNGFIISINWQSADKIYLPIDLGEKGKYIKTTVSPMAMFNISMGEGIISASYLRALIYSEENKMLFIDFNKRKYDTDFKLKLGDEETFINNVIVAYIFDNDLEKSLELRDKLIKKYHSYIISTYFQEIENNLFNPEVFMEKISQYIHDKEYLISTKNIQK